MMTSAVGSSPSSRQRSDWQNYIGPMTVAIRSPTSTLISVNDRADDSAAFDWQSLICFYWDEYGIAFLQILSVCNGHDIKAKRSWSITS